MGTKQTKKNRPSIAKPEDVQAEPEDISMDDSEAVNTSDNIEGELEEDAKNAPLPSEALEVVNIYLKSIARSSLLTHEEEIALAERIAQGDSEARQKMIESNLRLVICLAKRYISSGFPLSDLIEEGNIGLIKAVEKYDPRRGFRFSTYAAWWIRQNIQRAIINGGKVVRLPVHIVEQINRYLSCLEDLVQERGKTPEIFEIAQTLGIKEKAVDQIQQLLKQTYSLDAPLQEGHDTELTLQDLIADEDQASPGTQAEESHRRKKLVVWLQSISEIERRIILLRFGFIGDECWTLEQIGKEMGLTRERIRQIEISALKSLRNIVGNASVCATEIL